VILLLDAQVLLWWWADDRRLGQPARRSIADPGHSVVVSAGTVWEISVKRVAGRLKAPANILETLQSEQFDVLPITGDDAMAAAELPQHHRDPFDRLLIAQALRLDALIITSDRALAAYEAQILPA
jgi:PIN domain nuclease of toxin-antitoxin system